MGRVGGWRVMKRVLGRSYKLKPNGLEALAVTLRRTRVALTQPSPGGRGNLGALRRSAGVVHDHLGDLAAHADGVVGAAVFGEDLGGVGEV